MTTCDIYRAGNAPPAAADVAGVACTLIPAFEAGRETGEGESGNLRYTHLLIVAATVDIRDGFSEFVVTTGNRDTVYIPNSVSIGYVVAFVERVGNTKKAYLNRKSVSWPFPNVQSVLPAGGGAVGGGAATIVLYSTVQFTLTGSGGAVGGDAATIVLYNSLQFSLTGNGGTVGGGEASWSYEAGPTYRIQDSFNVSNQTNNGRTPDTTNTPGNTWSNIFGTVSVVSNKLEGTTWDSGYQALSVIENGQRAASVSADIALPNTTNRNIGGIVFRYSDVNNYWYAKIECETGNPSSPQNNKIHLRKIVSGVDSAVNTASITINVATTYALFVTDDGTNIAATIGATSATASSTDLNTNTKVGSWLLSLAGGSGGSPSMDEFKVT